MKGLFRSFFMREVIIIRGCGMVLVFMCVVKRIFFSFVLWCLDYVVFRCRRIYFYDMEEMSVFSRYNFGRNLGL